MKVLKDTNVEDTNLTQSTHECWAKHELGSYKRDASSWRQPGVWGNVEVW